MEPIRPVPARVPRRRPARAPTARPEIDLVALEKDLRREVRGEVAFDKGARALYALDASNYRQIPHGVVCPFDAADVEAAMAMCRRHGAPVLSRGGGTSLAGQCVNAAVVLDVSPHMHRIVEIDPKRRIARVQPGVILDALRKETERHGLTFAPDPATHDRCTIGGMIGNNSCGVHSVMAGRTADNVHALDVLTYDGHRMTLGAYDDRAYDQALSHGGPRARVLSKLRVLRDRYGSRIRERYPNIPRRVSGYNLDELLPERGFHVARALVGTEGTCVAVLEAELALVPSPPYRALAVLGYDDVFQAADDVPAVLAAGPIGLEGMDHLLVHHVEAKQLHMGGLRLIPEGRGFLLAEFGAWTEDEAAQQAHRLVRRLRRSADASRVLTRRHEQKRVWEVRESGLAATARVPGEPDAWPGWEDSAVPPERLGEYLRALRALMERYGYEAALYGHFGDGCVHCRINFDLTSRRGIAAYRRFVEEAADLVVGLGGSLSGEHGDGQSRAELLERMVGGDLVEAFREFKRIWDPEGRMNPGKVVDPRPLDADLRLGEDYAPAHPETVFRYPDDDGSLARATLRCVGVGKCRQHEGGTMCPSYRVTLDEKHSTRGRAHLLHEMLVGDSPIDTGFRSEEVRESLDLCLSCKGCMTECPMQVDLATYKAEFLYRYYKGRLRPRSSWSLALIWRWARLASWAPELANLLVRAPGLGTLTKQLAGIAPQREVPAFAPRTFRSWFRAREPRRVAGERVLLWVDTWTDHFQPEVGIAAVEVLEAAGFHPEILRAKVCCGRPLYDHGMLDQARALLREVLDAAKPWVDQGVPIVFLEPSCFSTFRDELRLLWPDDPEASRFRSRIVTFAQLLDERAPDFAPRLERELIVHGHCHQKSSTGLDAEARVLGRIGAKAEVLDSGCCGMAGTFGYEPHKVDVSLAIGEQVLLPAVRQASDQALVMSDGFSCRSQIEEQTERRALHLAQILQLALRGGPQGPQAVPIERAAEGSPGPSPRRIVAWTAALVASLAALVGALWRRRR